MEDSIASFLSFAEGWYPYGVPRFKNSEILVSFVTSNIKADKELIAAAAEKGMKLDGHAYETQADIESCTGRFVIVMGAHLYGGVCTEGTWDPLKRCIGTVSAVAIQSSYDEKKKFWEHLKIVLGALWE